MNMHHFPTIGIPRLRSNRNQSKPISSFSPSHIQPNQISQTINNTIAYQLPIHSIQLSYPFNSGLDQDELATKLQLRKRKEYVSNHRGKLLNNQNGVTLQPQEARMKSNVQKSRIEYTMRTIRNHERNVIETEKTKRQMGSKYSGYPNNSKIVVKPRPTKFGKYSKRKRACIAYYGKHCRLTFLWLFSSIKYCFIGFVTYPLLSKTPKQVYFLTYIIYILNIFYHTHYYTLYV